MKVMKTPRDVEIAITARCNLRCSYCSYFSSPADVDTDLPKAVWLSFFEKLRQCAVMNMTLEGGEPFCREDIHELIHGIIRNHMRFNILSNGTLITDEIAAFLVSTKRCNGVQVSIDGSIPETHDSFRGKGNFSRAMNGIQALMRHDVPVQVRVTIHRQNVNDLEEVARFLLDEIGLPGFSTNAASYMGLCRQNKDKTQLTIEERVLAMKTLFKLDEKYKGRISASAGPLADIKGWLEMEKARKDGVDHLPGGGYLTGCGGVMSKIAIRADGVIVPCIQLSHIELGNIQDDDFKKIWQNHDELNRLRNRQHMSLNDFEFCRGCEYTNYCTGNCPALAYTIVGDENHPSPDACLRKFVKEGGVLPNLQ